MDRPNQISSLVWLLMGLFIVVESLFSLKIGTVYDPGPGLFPLIMGILLSFFSLVILLKATFAKGVEKKKLSKLWAGLNWPKMFCTIGGLSFYPIILNTAGFLLTTLLLLIFLLRIIKRQNWKLTIGLSIFTSVGFYLFFDRLLQVQLPRGILGF